MIARFPVRTFAIACACAGLAAAVACGGNEPPPEAPPAPPTVVSAPPPVVSETPPPVDTTPVPPPAPPIEFVEGTPAAAPDKAPKISIKAPSNGQKITVDKAGDFEVKLDLKNWETGMGEVGHGQHVHLILDGRPYKRIDDWKQPIKLKDIDPNYTIGEGQHVLVAFPSRHTHESVKPIGKDIPLAITSFVVGKAGEVTWKPKDPMMIFSRPKGANNGPGPADGILVDFYLSNAELGDGKFSIDATLTGPGATEGKKVNIKKWVPYRLKNLQTGTYSLHLTLLDKDGKTVPGAWNDVTREFQVDTAATNDDHAGMAMGAPAASGSAAPAGSAPHGPPIRHKAPPAGSAAPLDQLSLSMGPRPHRTPKTAVNSGEARSHDRAFPLWREANEQPA